MWRPATYAIESMVSWFVNQVLIGEVDQRADVEAIRAFVRDFPREDPLSYFRDVGSKPMPAQWLWEHAVRGQGKADFAFPSDVVSGVPNNDRVRGVSLLHPSRDRGAAMILLHGWITPDHRQSRWVARELLKSGFSTFMVELPYHMRRSPPGVFSGLHLIQPDLRLFVEALKQAVADVAKLVRGLQELGYTRIHLCGISLGAYVSTVVANLAPISSLSLVMPLVDIGYTFRHSPMLSAARKLLEHHHISLDELDDFFAPFGLLNNFQPDLPRERILLVNALDDQITFSHKVRELWEAWDHPALFEEPHGHVSLFFAKGPFRRMAAHLGHRAAQHTLTERTALSRWPARSQI